MVAHTEKEADTNKSEMAIDNDKDIEEGQLPSSPGPSSSSSSVSGVKRPAEDNEHHNDTDRKARKTDRSHVSPNSPKQQHNTTAESGSRSAADGATQSQGWASSSSQHNLNSPLPSPPRAPLHPTQLRGSLTPERTATDDAKSVEDGDYSYRYNGRFAYSSLSPEVPSETTLSPAQSEKKAPSSSKRRPEPRKFFGCSRYEDYEPIKKIGEGTFGEVSTARHKTTGKVVALKKILMHNEKEGIPITALREIKILKALKHDNVVPLNEIAFKKGLSLSKNDPLLSSQD
ncbi:serine/threonine protein kinase, CMGC, CDC2/CDK sub [Quaeritorhiza haematococci]|nr:serine/threonine protein kinase, CMGC, CDC2/CDK sub [Quaeritorhiza haematococci]